MHSVCVKEAQNAIFIRYNTDFAAELRFFGIIRLLPFCHKISYILYTKFHVPLIRSTTPLSFVARGPEVGGGGGLGALGN